MLLTGHHVCASAGVTPPPKRCPGPSPEPVKGTLFAFLGLCCAAILSFSGLAFFGCWYVLDLRVQAISERLLCRNASIMEAFL